MSANQQHVWFGKAMDRRVFLRRLAGAVGVSAASASLLVACGGGSSESTPSPASATTASGTGGVVPTPGNIAPGGSSSGSSAGTPSASPVAVSTQAASTAKTPKKGGVFKIPVNTNVTPWPPIGQIQNLMVNKSLFNGLVRFSADDWSPQPDLAEKWEISSDRLTWTFTLRKGVQWHDGQPFTADDVKWSLQMYADPKVNSILRGNLAPITNIETPDQYTVKLTSKDPYSSLPELLCYLTFMLPKHLLEGQQFDNANFPQAFIQKPIGTGPFKFGEHQPGDHFTVLANDNYHEGRPYLDQVIYRIVKDQNSTISQVKTGELDIAFPNVAQLAGLQGTSNLNVIEQGLMDFRFFSGYQKNPKFGPWFSDKRVRVAMAHAIDADGIIKQVTQGKAKRSNGPIPPALKNWYFPDLPVYDYNPDTATKQLMDIGFTKGSDGILQKDGQKFSFIMYTDSGQPEREQTALIIQQNFKDVGIEAKYQAIEFAELNKRYRVDHDFESMAYYYVTPSTPDLHSYWQTGGSTNEWAYSNPTVDKLFQDGLAEFDPEKRKAIYKQVFTILAEEQAVNYIYHPLELQAINKKINGWANTDYRDALLYLNKVWIE
jgi:peptide/nickel transport system substrate-binding protein